MATSTRRARQGSTTTLGRAGLTLVLACGGLLAAAAPPAAGSTHAEVIIWTSRAATGSEHLMIADERGGDARPLTPATPDQVELDAQVSPDGRWVAYERDVADTAEVRLIRPDGTRDHAVDIACVDPCVAVVSPTWLSRRRLAYSIVNGPFTDAGPASVVLWSARLDGTGARRMSAAGIEGIFEESNARVSRDGTYLVFKRFRSADAASALFRTDPRGRHLQRLTPWAYRAEVFDLSTASHGPTRDLIVFESYGRGTAEDTFVDLATVPATCHTARRCRSQLVWLTDNESTGRRNANPQWSPDGRSLVFTDRSSFDEPNAEIWAARFDGTDRRQISSYEGFDYRPTWGVG